MASLPFLEADALVTVIFKQPSRNTSENYIFFIAICDSYN